MRKTLRTTGKALRTRGALGLQGRLGRLFLESGVINLMANFLLSTGLLGLLCLALPDSVRADTVYTYTGKAYTDCLGVYCTGGPFALNVTFDVLAGTPLDNLTLGGTGLITADVSTFSFIGGTGLEISLPTATSYSFDMATDSSGNLLSWFIFASTQNKTRWRRVMNTENTPSV